MPILVLAPWAEPQKEQKPIVAQAFSRLVRLSGGNRRLAHFGGATTFNIIWVVLAAMPNATAFPVMLSHCRGALIGHCC